MKKLKLSIGEVELPEKLTPEQVELIRNKANITAGGGMKDIGSWLWEIPKQVVKNVEGVNYNDLSVKDRDMIANEYIDLVRGFLPK